MTKEKESNVVSMKEREEEKMTNSREKGKLLAFKKYDDESVRNDVLDVALNLLDVWQREHPGMEVRFYPEEQKYVVVKYEEIDVDAVVEELSQILNDAEGVTVL